MSIFNKKPYLAAVSGGPDSIALLHMYRKHIKVVCTVKYNKRKDCQHDVDCVKKLCDKYKIPLEVLDVTPEIYKQYSKDTNFQSQARKIRYDFFNETAKKYHVSKLLIAHHLDDYLETAYSAFSKESKNLYYGIKEKSQYLDLEIYRPFITRFRKRTLARYCADYDLEYATDSSNVSDEYERNRIRKIINAMSNDEVHELMKKTKKYNKEHAKLYDSIQRHFKNWKITLFDVKMFKTFTDEEQYYLIYEFLNYHEIYRPNQNKINGIIEFIKGMNGKEYRVSDNISLFKKNSCLEIKIK